MLTSYHNHTCWSDGTPTLEEHLAAAVEAGLDEFGLSDHYVITPDAQPATWSMPLDFLDDYVAALQSAAAAQDGLIVRLGLEADFFPETVEKLRQTMARHPFDYIIGAVHILDGFPVDSHRHHWEVLTPEERNGKWKRYWEQIRAMALSRAFDFAAHLDLPKKYSFRPTADFTAEMHAALDAIAEADMAMEINTAGWSLEANEAYPSEDILQEAHKRGIPILINADAHSPAHLTRNFDRARDLARRCGYTEVVRYQRRKRFSVPLE